MRMEINTSSQFLATRFLILFIILISVCSAQSYRQHKRRAQECATYTPTICGIPNAHAIQSHCQSNCHFDVDRTFFCPLIAAGYFSYRTGGEGGGCTNPFMAQTHHLPPACGARCCRTDHTGIFVEEDPILEPALDDDYATAGTTNADVASSSRPPRLFSFVPNDSTCRYKEITRGQLMRFLAMHNSTLTVVGDSFMRQMFIKMVAMMRGQQRHVDYHIHTHAQYQVCREVDVLRLAQNNPVGDAMQSDSRFLKDVVTAFFKTEIGPGQADAKRILAECSHHPVQMAYLQAPLFNSQIDALDRFMKSLEIAHKPVLVLSVGFWQTGDSISPSYLKTLEDLRENALRIFFIGVPTISVKNEHKRQELKTRNKQMQQWIERQGSPYSYVDFDAMVGAALNATALPASVGNKHFSCWLLWKNLKFSSASGSGQLHGHIEELHSDPSGECSDELNRNLWQVILNSVLDNSGAQALAVDDAGEGNE